MPAPSGRVELRHTRYRQFGPSGGRIVRASCRQSSSRTFPSGVAVRPSSPPISNVVQVIFGDAASTTPQVAAGQLRALAVTASKRSPKLPDVPTVAEAGVSGYEVAAWHGYFRAGRRPAGDHREAQSRDQRNSERSRDARPARPGGYRSRRRHAGCFRAHLKDELTKWGKIAKEAGIKLN